MYMGKKKKLRTCANMNGILGGSNAFNYISFVLAILTLIVQTNNNINNNNNNLNQGMGPIKNVTGREKLKLYIINSSLPKFECNVIEPLLYSQHQQCL